MTDKSHSGNVSRGGFLKVLGATILSPWMDRLRLFAAAGDLLSTSPGPAAARFHLLDAGAALFRCHVDTTFLVRPDSGAPVPLRLASVAERPLTGDMEQFSLVFHARTGAPDLHGTRAFEHAILGRFDAFIVPVGAAAARHGVYEACFSRSVRTSHG